MQNIVGLQDRLVKAAAAVGRGALPVLASGLQSRNTHCRKLEVHLSGAPRNPSSNTFSAHALKEWQHIADSQDNPLSLQV